ncbi:Bug family tripartite tricarboxylate transporter substrate binding protein [Ottowia thiooxydans]|uniref:Bug family tripartite tricarboxylate transporter substrate binding protein n=1 Tax=Ottowia thiooxydans TaxID=219182 RepID=UPI000422C53C|nr:tripartite tricarboxylate transporter substrate binding protein [Ottowia thiooxydans]
MDRRSFLAGAGAVALAAPSMSFAQEKFPSRVINFIVPVAAGGGSDYVARATTTEWGKSLGTSFVVENLGGGGGVVACQKTMRAKPDGYTLMQGYVATLGTAPATRQLPYDPIKSFTSVGMIGGTPNVLAVDAKLPIRSFDEFLKYVKDNRHTNYGSAGAGSLTHLLMELLKQRSGFASEHVAYKGIAPAFNDIMGGSTQFIFPGLAAAVPHAMGGKVRLLAVTGKQRSKRFPDVPTFEELGVKGFDDVLQWYGVSGPAGMPAEIVTTLNTSLNKVLENPGLEKTLAIEAIIPMPMSAGEFDAYMRKDLERWQRIAKAQNIRLDA